MSATGHWIKYIPGGEYNPEHDEECLFSVKPYDVRFYGVGYLFSFDNLEYLHLDYLNDEPYILDDTIWFAKINKIKE